MGLFIYGAVAPIFFMKNSFRFKKSMIKLRKQLPTKCRNTYVFDTVFMWQSGTFGNFFVPIETLGFA